MIRKCSALFLACLALAALSGFVFTSPSEAAITFVTDRDYFAGNDFIDWGQLGPQYTLLTSSPNVTSSSGTVAATLDFPPFSRYDQGPGAGWEGNFAEGDHLIYSFSPPMEINFNSSIFGAGAQIQMGNYGDFFAVISAYNNSNELLGFVWLAGISNSNNDNSAIFLGVLDTTAEITKIVYNVNIYNGSDYVPMEFAINQLDLKTSPVPLPGAVWLLGSGLLGLGASGWRRRRRE